MFPSVKTLRARQNAREQRTLNDWERPVPDQYPGITRTAVQEFLNSSETDRRIPELDPASLNTSLRTLGMDGQCYAEQRANGTYLRRILTDVDE